MNAIKNKKESNKTDGKIPSKKGIHNFFASTRLSIILLVLIAAGSIVGTLIRQGATEEEYLSVYAEGTYNIIKLFGFNDVYHSTWFYLLMVLFALNLTLCTINLITRIVRGRRRTAMPQVDGLLEMELSVRILQGTKERVMERIAKAYRLAYKNNEGMVFEKGRLSLWGVPVIHGSVIVILAGALTGLAFGSRGFVVLGIGETKDRMITTRNGEHQDKPLGFAVRCKDFKADFYPGGTPKDYVSTIEVLEKDTVVLKKDIRVNDPLYYKGLRIYQSGYGQGNAFKFRVGGEEVMLAEQEVAEKENLLFKIVRFEKQVHSFGPGVQVVYLDGKETKTTWFLMNVDRLKSQKLQGVDIALIDIQNNPFTSLEVASDPGVFVVWTGFALMLLGLYINFFTYYRRIFVADRESDIIIAGYALRNKEAFRKEFEKLQEGKGGNA